MTNKSQNRDCHGNIMQKYGLAMTKKLQRPKKERRLLRFGRNDSKEIKGNCHGRFARNDGTEEVIVPSQ